MLYILKLKIVVQPCGSNLPEIHNFLAINNYMLAIDNAKLYIVVTYSYIIVHASTYYTLTLINISNQVVNSTTTTRLQIHDYFQVRDVYEVRAKLVEQTTLPILLDHYECLEQTNGANNLGAYVGRLACLLHQCMGNKLLTEVNRIRPATVGTIREYLVANT